MGDVTQESQFKSDGVILLAAGDSKRMGHPKGLVRFQNRPWIQVQIEALKKIGFEKIVVVLGNDAPGYFVELPGLQEIAVINSSPEEGPFLSVLFGVEALTPFQPTGIWILPVDVPVPGDEVWRKMSEAAKDLKAVIPSCMESGQWRGGHPVRLSSEWAGDLLNQRTQGGPLVTRLDESIRGLPPNQKKWVEVNDPRIRMNLNSREEFERYERKVTSH